MQQDGIIRKLLRKGVQAKRKVRLMGYAIKDTLPDYFTNNALAPLEREDIRDEERAEAQKALGAKYIQEHADHMLMAIKHTVHKGFVGREPVEISVTGVHHDTIPKGTSLKVSVSAVNKSEHKEITSVMFIIPIEIGYDSVYKNYFFNYEFQLRGKKAYKGTTQDLNAIVGSFISWVGAVDRWKGIPW
jgi:hypothetical protein